MGETPIDPRLDAPLDPPTSIVDRNRSLGADPADWTVEIADEKAKRVIGGGENRTSERVAESHDENAEVGVQPGSISRAAGERTSPS
jgi:hypothetical protein